MLAEMNGKNYSQARMAEETGLAYNTVKKYLRQMETEAT
jgi:predicted transcriptional regulator